MNYYKNQSNTIPWTLELILACQQATNISMTIDSNILSEMSLDFGKLKTGRPIACFYPNTVTQCQGIIQFSYTHKLQLVIRGRGFSQGGQTLAPEGVVILDCSQMSEVYSPDFQSLTIKCQSGASWRSITDVTLLQGFVPRVIPFFPDLSVGGVLSVGGIGATSHNYGCISNNIEELEVITGTGDLNICSLYQNKELLEASLCGLGRCALITTATIKLRKFKPYTKTFYIHYPDHHSWLEAQKYFVDAQVDYIESFCTPIPLGLQASNNGWIPLTHWFFSMQISIEYDDKEPTLDNLKLENFNGIQIIKTGIALTADFLVRYGVRAQNIKKSGMWNLAHPWWEIMLPYNKFYEVLPDLLQKIPLFFGDGLSYRIFSLHQNTPRSFIKVGDGLMIGFAFLTSGVQPERLDQVLQILQELDEWLLPLGGKRYLSGWLGTMSDQKWQQHYQEYYKEWIDCKIKYDSHNVFNSLILDKK